jgi:hypothetical protein
MESGLGGAAPFDTQIKSTAWKKKKKGGNKVRRYERDGMVWAAGASSPMKATPGKPRLAINVIISAVDMVSVAG